MEVADSYKLPPLFRRGGGVSPTGWRRFADGVVVLKESDPNNTSKPKERLHNLSYLKTFRTNLRKRMTPAEAALWNSLKNSQIDGRKFRRQHSVGNYILDFFCISEQLAIELDGEAHRNDNAELYDLERKLFLKHFGIKVSDLRIFWSSRSVNMFWA